MSSAESTTRDRILDAALARLEVAGPDGRGARMSDVAQAAGVSRQAVYLHFSNRAALLTAAARRLDEIHDIDAALAASRAASSGAARLDAFITAWAGHLPKIYGVARALLAMRARDADAAAAWEDRMAALRQGCAAAAAALAADGALDPEWTEAEATDLLMALLSVRGWEELVCDRGWPQARYLEAMKRVARRIATRPSGRDAGEHPR